MLILSIGYFYALGAATRSQAVGLFAGPASFSLDYFYRWLVVRRPRMVQTWTALTNPKREVSGRWYALPAGLLSRHGADEGMGELVKVVQVVPVPDPA